MKIIIDAKGSNWVPHPTVKNVFIKTLVTKKEFGDESPTIFLVKVPKGAFVPKHTHAVSEDILYILAGRAKMFVEGVGEFKISEGMLIRVPRDTEHSMFDVSEDVLVYDIFAPATI
ncbi:MAG: cupin domain-containing protein [Caldisericota bacterium]|nr:cupin domain-containing protein [Caldisericota bacterium]